jgi:putative hemolysin
VVLLLVEVLVILAFVVTNGLLAMSEAAFVAARKERLRQLADGGDAGGRAALAFKEEPVRFLSTVQVGITLVGVLAGAVGGTTFAAPLAGLLAGVPVLGAYAYPVAFAVVVVAVSYLSLVAGELAPKRLALSDPERVVALVARPLSALAVALTPVNALLTASTALLLRLLPVRVDDERPPNEEEVRDLLAQATRAGVFHAAEERLVQAVFALGDRRVAGLMTPRSKIVWVDADAPPAAQQRRARESGHDYFPVCRGGLDGVRGVVAAAELWRAGAPGGAEEAQRLRPAAFVPEHLRALDALEEFKRAGAHLLLVDDEHGALVGLLTLTDVLQAIVGEVPGAGAAAEAAPVRRGDGSWLLDGATPLAELRRRLEAPRLGEDDGPHDTLGGLVRRALGRLPMTGDRFEAGGWRFEVVDMDGQRVDRVLASPTRGDGDRSVAA